MGHAGAIVGEGGQGSAASKMKYLAATGINVANTFADLGPLMDAAMKGKGSSYQGVTMSRK